MSFSLAKGPSTVGPKSPQILAKIWKMWKHAPGVKGMMPSDVFLKTGVPQEERVNGHLVGDVRAGLHVEPSVKVERRSPWGEAWGPH